MNRPGFIQAYQPGLPRHIGGDDGSQFPPYVIRRIHARTLLLPASFEDGRDRAKPNTMRLTGEGKPYCGPPSYAVMSTVLPAVEELSLFVDDVDVLVDAVLELILPP